MPFCLPPADLWGAAGDAEASYRLMLLGLAAFTAAWLAAVGASIGSFLNVVVYRLPQGMSLVRPKSRCPSCGTSIRRGDNVPVFGWLRLRGRCRTCGLPISARYPLVEALTAAIFLGLAHVELFSGEGPFGRSTGHDVGLTWVLWHIRWERLALYAYHLVLACLLLCIALITWDGHRPPRSLVLKGLLLGLLAPVALPLLHPVPAGWPVPPARWSYQPSAATPAGFFPAQLVTGLTGLTAGALIGIAISFAASAEQRRGTTAAVSLVGLFLGWQAAVCIGLLAAVAAWPLALLARTIRRPLPTTAAAALALAIWFGLAGASGRLEWWPGANGWPILRRLGWPEASFVVTSATAAVAVAGIAAWVACGIAGRSRPDTADPTSPEVA